VAPLPPPSLEELLERAHGLAGLTLGALAARLAVPLPANLGRHKGFIGSLVERALGTSAGCLPIPDFPHLGVELKTLPMLASGRARESTFVCSASFEGLKEETWASSRVLRKLAHVLFVPVEHDRSRPASERRLGRPVYFEPDEAEEAVLRADWEDLAALLAAGLADAVSARRGVALQVRPKAANATVKRQATGEEGERFCTLPRGFYLRRTFTEAALARRLGRQG
jgi:DNA mismatch repair protein MutH